MAEVQFIFWELTKALALIFLGLFTVKASASWRARERQRPYGRPAIAWAFYAFALALVILGARSVGDDIAAEVYARTSQRNLDGGDLPKAYSNALRAVQLRPGEINYWRVLAKVKIAARQYASLLEDEGAFHALARGPLDEDDAMRFVVSHFSLSQYEQAVADSQDMIRRNRMYPAPYIVEGSAQICLKSYAEAERTFLQLLQFFPTQVEGVTGLAHAYFLAGDTARALAVLNATNKYPFSPEARQRFEALTALYAQ